MLIKLVVIALYACLIAMSAFFSSCEITFARANKNRIEKDAEKDSKKGKKTTPEAKAKLVKVVAEVLNKIETEDLDNGN